MAKATRRGFASGVNDGLGSVTVVPGSDIQVGDWMIVAMAGANSGRRYVAPSGWTSFSYDTSNVGTRSVAFFGKRRAANDGSYVFSITTSAGAASTSSTSWTLAYGPGGVVDPASWQLGTLMGRSAAGGTGVTNKAPSITPAANNELVIALAMEATSAAETEAQVSISGATKWYWYGGTTGVIQTWFVGYIEQTAKAATPDIIFTYPNSQTTNGGAMQIGIPELLDTVATASIFYADGGLKKAANIWWGDGTAKKPVGKVSVVPAGLLLPQLQQKYKFVIAHRGGSLNFPEMSLQAYTNSVMLGVDALEVSLARTSDGVWFGLHDDTLDRTSGTTNFKPGEHTWAEVQAYRIAVPAGSTGQVVQPYMTLTQILTAYSKHTIFIDPKVAGGSRFPELLDILMAQPNAVNRFVAKYYYSGTTWADQARARGLLTWGYWYGAEVDADPTILTNFQAKWDFLGMDYGGSVAAWNQAMSYGKPVIGHIVPSAAAAQTAWAKGAYGIMASGVKEVLA